MTRSSPPSSSLAPTSSSCQQVRQLRRRLAARAEPARAVIKAPGEGLAVSAAPHALPHPYPHANPFPGFDAHKRDEINFRYIGVTERDYEWLTDQLVQVANRSAASQQAAGHTHTATSMPGQGVATLGRAGQIAPRERAAHLATCKLPTCPGDAQATHQPGDGWLPTPPTLPHPAGAAPGVWCRRWRAGTAFRAAPCRRLRAASRRTCVPWWIRTARPGTRRMPRCGHLGTAHQELRQRHHTTPRHTAPHRPTPLPAPTPHHATPPHPSRCAVGA